MWKNENFLPKVLGAISWLMVSIGTFLVASGYLGVIDGGFETDMLKRIGYGIVMYAIAAIFVALNRYFKNP